MCPKYQEGDSYHQITSHEDPQGRGNVLDGKWVVKDKLEIGKLVDGIRIVRCPYIAIQRGDFVEMLLEVTVGSAGPKRHVQFNLQQIIRVEEKRHESVSACRFTWEQRIDRIW